jgi:hypothetical protein
MTELNEGAPEATADSERRLRLQCLETWWIETKNPLLIWEAIALSEDPLPEFCKGYLRDVAIKLTESSRRCAALAPADRAKDAQHALTSLSGFLGLTREREKNAFARYADDAEDIWASVRAKVSAEFKLARNEDDEVAKIAGDLNVSKDTARRHLTRGHRLTGKKKPKAL